MPPPVLTLSPDSVNVTTTEGTEATFTVTATLSQEAVETISFLQIVYLDNGDIVRLQSAPGTRTDVSTTFHANPSLSVGSHSGQISFYACMDAACTRSTARGPFTLPYQIIVNPAPPAMEVTPASIAGTVEVGDPLSIEVQVQVKVGIEVYSFAAVDAKGRFESGARIISHDGQQFTVELTARTFEAPGSYPGTVNLVACPATSDCTESIQVPGSPFAISYDLTINPETILPPVPSASGLPEWETFQGNPAHTGYVPVTLDAETFNLGWSWSVPESGQSDAVLSPATTGSGKVVVATNKGSAILKPVLYALRESDGMLTWQHDFELGSFARLNHPAVSSGRVFVATSGHADTFMWSFDIGTGDLQFQVPFASQWDRYLAPTLKNGYIYAEGNYHGGLYAFKQATGVRRWFAPLQQYDLWTPAVDDANVYAYTSNEFTVFDRSTGERKLSLANNEFNWAGYSLNMAPVLPGSDSALVVDGIYTSNEDAHQNHLIRYSISGARETWRLSGQFRSTPVVASGKLYIINNDGRRLEARDLATGALLWSWSPTDPEEALPIGNLVLTDNLVFIPTSAATYAIDLASHQPVWSTPRTGQLALSSNLHLYIVNAEARRLDAYRLVP